MANIKKIKIGNTTYDIVDAGAIQKDDIKSGNDDIVINRPTESNDAGKTVISHKEYDTTYSEPDAVSDTNFVTGVDIENGHVTEVSVTSLAEALATMSFIFDGGTAADTITNNQI